MADRARDLRDDSGDGDGARVDSPPFRSVIGFLIRLVILGASLGFLTGYLGGMFIFVVRYGWSLSLGGSPLP